MGRKRKNQHEEFDISKLDGLTLPFPEPRKEAVLAGLFGVAVEIMHWPSPEEIQSITYDQACEMLHLRERVARLYKCACGAISNVTGKGIKTDSLEGAIGMMEQEAEGLRRQYAGFYNTYEAAFGSEAARDLGIVLRQVMPADMESSLPMPVAAPQCELF